MTNSSLTHPTPDDDGDELDTGVNVQNALHLDPSLGLPRHGSAADGGQTSPALMGVAALVGFVIGGGIYGFAASAHGKQHTPAAEIIKVPAPTPLAETAKAAAAETQKDSDEPEAKPATPSESEAKADPESQMLDAAREQLSAGNAGAALISLEHMRKKFPKGDLAQDRELLRIEALKAKGQRGAAKSAARKFAKQHPNNPHLGELESLLIGQQ
jgi:hypothetical protein